MKLYAETPARREWQIATDMFVLAWLAFWIWLAVKLYDLVLKLGVPGQKLQGAGDGMADGLADAGAKVHRVPVAGDSLSEPFTKAANAARTLADAGRSEQHTIGQLAWVLAALLLAVPLAVVLLGWLPWRVRWARRAGVAAALRGSGAGADLLALRALATHPLRRLSTVDDDPVAAWRQGDQRVITALAALELRRLGLRQSRRRTSSTVDGPAP
jgi:hypothetical protein